MGGARSREGTTTQPSWPGVRQGRLTASLGAFPDAPVPGSNPDPTTDSRTWLPSPHWLHSGHVGTSFLLLFQTCPPPSCLSAPAAPIPPTLARHSRCLQESFPTSPPKSGYPPPPMPRFWQEPLPGLGLRPGRRLLSMEQKVLRKEACGLNLDLNSSSQV